MGKPQIIKNYYQRVKQNALFRHIYYMKYLFFIAAGFIIPALFSGCAGLKTETKTEEKQAVYEGSAPGYRGIIRVRVGFENGVFTEITVVESREDRVVGGAAMEELADMVLFYNTTDIDVISGATVTSEGFLAAIENAVTGNSQF